ncbi:MAG: LL-diaminopimelate aminotransferase [Actinomycetota bacterium]
MRTARRIDTLPPYLFAELDRKLDAARAKGVDVISFGIGDPDRPTPAHIVEAAAEAVRDPSTHRYPSYYGMPAFRQAVAAFYRRRFGVELDPDSQVQPLIGSKEGIANLATAFVDPGDGVLVSDPGYPVYETGSILAGGTVEPVPLSAEDGFLPRFDRIPAEAAARSKVLWLNFPGNPTAAVCDVSLFEEAGAFAAGHDLLLAHDSAYSEITYDGYVAPSVLQAPGAADHAIEFGSLSKTYNMTGWRIGWAVGAPKAVEALGRVKTNIDSGIFNALQRAGIAALEGPQDCVAEMVATYRRRRDVLVEALTGSGWPVPAPKGSIYIWAPVPEGFTSVGLSELLLERAGVFVTPGSGYGPNGEGYVRLSLTVPDDRLEEGAIRIAKVLAEG